MRKSVLLFKVVKIRFYDYHLSGIHKFIYILNLLAGDLRKRM